MTHKVYNPFLKIEEILEKFNDEKLDWIILDFHKEVSSSGYGIVHYFWDKISFVYGTHTHVQTNDDYIFDSWIGILSDVWMTGPINSVIGADFKTVQNRFLTWINKWKIEQSLDKKYILNAVCVEIENWNTKNIEKIKIIDKL
jgi:calcineurin-like phosphoesterase